MMDGNYAELEAQVRGRQRALVEEAAAERMARAGRPRSPVRLRRARSLLAAGLVTVAAWLDERYAERRVLPGSWVRIA